MYRAVMVISLLVLGGCASGPDSQAARDADETPLASRGAEAAPVARLEAPGEPVAAIQAPGAALKVQALAQPMAAVTLPVPAGKANPTDPAVLNRLPGAAHATAPDSPWGDLTRRVTAWATPLRRTLEPYCQDGLVRNP